MWLSTIENQICLTISYWVCVCTFTLMSCLNFLNSNAFKRFENSNEGVKYIYIHIYSYSGAHSMIILL